MLRRFFGDGSAAAPSAPTRWLSRRMVVRGPNSGISAQSLWSSLRKRGLPSCGRPMHNQRRVRRRERRERGGACVCLWAVCFVCMCASACVWEEAGERERRGLYRDDRGARPEARREGLVEDAHDLTAVEEPHLHVLTLAAAPHGHFEVTEHEVDELVAEGPSLALLPAAVSPATALLVPPVE